MSDRIISVLLLEDDEIDVMNVQRAFKKTGYQHCIHVAGNGKEALDILNSQKWGPECPVPEAILLDVNMPLMNGFEFLQEVRASSSFSFINVYMLTTSNSNMDIVRAYEQKVCGYIVKPVDFKAFTESIQILCDYWNLIQRPVIINKEDTGS